MALTSLANTIVKGALGNFQERIAGAANIWTPYAQRITSTSAKETHAFMGHVPVPREMMGERKIQEMIDFKFDVENSTYEATIAIPREDFEDQQVNRINTRFAELGEAFADWKDSLFALILTDNAAPPFASADNVTWANLFTSTGTVGDASSLDNDIGLDVVDPAAPTTAEMKTAIQNCVAQLRTMADDQNRLGYNSSAMSSLRILVPPEHEFAAKEAINATIIGNTSNVLQGLGQVDVFDKLTTNTTFYVAAVGATRKPLIAQERDALEVIVDTNPDRVAERNAVLVLTRERFKLTSGDPRRIIRQVLS